MSQNEIGEEAELAEEDGSEDFDPSSVEEHPTIGIHWSTVEEANRYGASRARMQL